MIVSSIPGRMRLRSHALRAGLRLERLRADIAAMDGVKSMEWNRRVGSLLIHYDAAKTTRDDFEVRVRAALEKISAAGQCTQKVGAGGTARVRANRWAKRGMLASLAVSLVLAGAGLKRWHALTGILFLHALGVHLWAHRRYLFR